uniref:Uncharacterized protein n=1 Tax=Vespula pensylvanica TaxID=30213 RepID=A0A834PBJ9_VESPE|nr:hypothetical protein H0235_003247 [Vespula pensylvanica]
MEGVASERGEMGRWWVEIPAATTMYGFVAGMLDERTATVWVCPDTPNTNTDSRINPKRLIFLGWSQLTSHIIEYNDTIPDENVDEHCLRDFRHGDSGHNATTMLLASVTDSSDRFIISEFADGYSRNCTRIETTRISAHEIAQYGRRERNKMQMENRYDDSSWWQE